uniref:Uncharacterized protein n=1 Tax=Anopheles quadriannulatus TaxID=34691 RepID=A0A182XQW1_ANOQN
MERSESKEIAKNLTLLTALLEILNLLLPSPYHPRVTVPSTVQLQMFRKGKRCSRSLINARGRKKSNQEG